MDKEKLKTIIYEALGEASALFMSNPQKGTEQIMPEQDLARIGNDMIDKITAL